MKKNIIFATLVLILAVVLSVDGQITQPYLFSPSQVIESSKINANFNKFADALNRTGGTMTGTLTSQAIAPSTNATYALGDTTHRFTTGWFSSNLTVGGTGAFTGAITGASFTGSVAASNVDSGTLGTARLGSGSATSSTYLRGDSSWVALYTPVKAYAATVANVLNTTTETTILTFDVTANDWADGDVIEVFTATLVKNNKGTDGTATLKVNAGAGAQITIASATFSDLPTEYKSPRVFYLQRIGSDVWVYGRPENMAWFRDTQSTPASGTSTPANFTSTLTISLKATLDAADASFYIKPQAARVLKRAAS